MRRRQLKYLTANGHGDTPRESASPFPLRDAPANGSERTERIERLGERIVEERRETIEKLADE